MNLAHRNSLGFGFVFVANSFTKLEVSVIHLNVFFRKPFKQGSQSLINKAPFLLFFTLLWTMGGCVRTQTFWKKDR